MSNVLEDNERWVRPEKTYHAHFDCFSGAAGDMMLAACLDSAGENQSNLLFHVVQSLEEGMPELRGEFSIETKQVWRGMGSIAAMHVNVQSKYNHEAAPVPVSAAPLKAKTVDSVHDHNHDHSQQEEHSHNHQHSHAHQHSHSHTSQEEHNHNHEHEHGHSSNQNSQGDHAHSHEHQHSTHSHQAGSIDSYAEATHIDSHGHSHSHAHDSAANGPLRNLPQIKKMLQEASVEHISPWVKERSIAAFTALAEAEAKTHGAASIETVHFHEVGAVDSIVDTVGTLIALDAMGVSTISCSRLPLGEGTVWTDHGLLPVPAPATLRLLVGMPTCPGPKGVTGELVTPTAAALLKVCVMDPSSDKATVCGRPPAFTIRKVGIGAGTKDFEKHPNILRLMLGDTVVVSGQNS